MVSNKGGISTPKDFPMIMIFTGDNGSDYGYKDGWTNEGIFQYTGEGQIGPMQFTKGNKAIREHVKDGEALYVFEYVRTGHVRFIGEMIYIGYHYRQAPDIEGNLRQAIVFELFPIEEVQDPVDASSDYQNINNLLKGKTLRELRRLADNSSSQWPTVKERKSLIRIRSKP